jgi:Cu2+-exporting ATPase
MNNAIHNLSLVRDHEAHGSSGGPKGKGCGCGCSGKKKEAEVSLNVQTAAKKPCCCGGSCSARAIARDMQAQRDAAKSTEVAPAEKSQASESSPAERRDFSEFDDAAFQERYVRVAAAGTREVDLFVPSVHCASCLRVIERLPSLLPGIVSASLDLSRKILRVRWSDDRQTLSGIAAHLASMGYPPSPAYRAAGEEARVRDDRRQLVRLGVAGLCAGNVMLISFALYGGQFEGMDDVTAQLLRYLSLAFTLVCLAWPGAMFFRGAWHAIRAKTVTMDVPITLGLFAAFAWSAIATIARTTESGVTASDIYFDSLSMLTFFLLIGRFVQHRQQRRAQDSIELLFSLTPASARVIDTLAGGEERTSTRPTSSLRAGEIVEVLPGDVVPADGVLCRGSSQFNTAILTGESMPTTLAEGDALAAGVTNLSRPVRVRVTATGIDTRVGQLMKLVADHSARRAPIVLLADRLALYFLVAMLFLAGVTVAIWWHVGPTHAILNAIALLIVSCPCGLGLATPMAMTVALGKAARQRLLIKGGSAIQVLATAANGTGTFCFDKTGTLTQGRLRLTAWTGDESTKPFLAALESQSPHPIASALARDLGGTNSNVSVSSISTIGSGIRGTVRLGDTNAQATADIAAGTEQFILSQGITIDARWTRESQRLATQGWSPILVARDGKVVGVAALGDPVRAEAKSLVNDLTNRGANVVILSGDHPQVVRGIALQLGIPEENAHGHVAPEAKARFIEDSRTRQPERTFVMIGDGVNDAAALAAADVGIAVHGGAEASLAAADVYCADAGLTPLRHLFDGSTQTMKTVRLALAVSLFYNVIASALSMAGYVSPLLAAVLMPVASMSTVAVAMMAWRLPAESHGHNSPNQSLEQEGGACPSFSS